MLRTKSKGQFEIWVCLFLACLFAFIGCEPTEKYKRTVQISEPIQAGSNLSAGTHNGYIKVTGADVNQCDITATIIARADTVENAQKLAEKVDVKLEDFGSNGLIVRIDKPELNKYFGNKYIRVNLDITSPRRTSLVLNTHNGVVNVTNISGDLEAHTHNGNVSAKNISGSAVLLTTHNGRVNVAYNEEASAVIDGYIKSHNGSITLKSPANLSVRLEASAHNGRIKTELPITCVGNVTGRNLKGTIGAGEGKLLLKTHNGSIHIK
jgi:hypothetical protein